MATYYIRVWRRTFNRPVYKILTLNMFESAALEPKAIEAKSITDLRKKLIRRYASALDDYTIIIIDGPQKYGEVAQMNLLPYCEAMIWTTISDAPSVKKKWTLKGYPVFRNVNPDTGALGTPYESLPNGYFKGIDWKDYSERNKGVPSVWDAMLSEKIKKSGNTRRI